MTAETLMAMGWEHEDGVDFSLWPIRRVPADETQASKDAEELLQRVTERSGLAELTAALNDFYSVVAVAEESGSSGSRETLPRMERAFNGWLSAFRSFDDRTKTWLSHEFGKDADTYEAFSTALNEEFDGNFAYRLACALRNASTHADRVINAARFVSNEGERGAEHKVVLELDPARLARDFPRIRAKTRDELLRADRNLDLRKVVFGVMQSCERAHAVVFDTLWPRLLDTVELVEGFHAEATAEAPPSTTGTGAVFVATPTASGLTLRQNPVREAWLVKRNRGEVDRVLERGAAPGMIWEDYTQSGPGGLYDRLST